MKKYLFLLIISLLMIPFAEAQKEDDIPLPKSLQTRNDKTKGSLENKKLKFTAGGYFGMSFGGYNNISVAPLFGVYPVVDWLLAGVSGTYMYTYDSYYKESYHDFGVGVFVRGLIWKQRIIAHLSYEYMNIGYYDVQGNKVRLGVHALYAGPGYRQKLGDRLSMFLVLMINVARSVEERGIFPDIYPNIGITYDF
jgi:hypothetical protein